MFFNHNRIRLETNNRSLENSHVFGDSVTYFQIIYGPKKKTKGE